MALHGMCGGHEVFNKVKVFVWSHLTGARSVQTQVSLDGVYGKGA